VCCLTDDGEDGGEEGFGVHLVLLVTRGVRQWGDVPVH
jgi:hypothetical protein